MSHAPVDLIRLSPNRNSPRNQKIDTITFHHFAGNLTIETVASLFQPTSRQASYNYGVGTDGRRVLIVREEDRSWASSSAANDHKAVTIGIANNTGAPEWRISDRAIQSAIELTVDVCKRHGIKSLHYDGTPNGSVTLHEMFANTNCPGPYLKSKLPEMLSEINRMLKGDSMILSSTQNRNHPFVLVIQKFLVEYLKPRKIITGGLQGIIGPTTERAINVFKKENGLPEDGTVDFGTAVKMIEVATSTMGNADLANELNKVKADLARETARISTLNIEIERLKSKNSALTSSNSALAKDYTEMSNKVRGLKQDIGERDTYIEILEENVANLKKQRPEEIIINWKDAPAMDLIIHAIKKMFGKE